MTEEDLAEVYARIRPRIWAVCFAILRNRDEADDATQETFVRLVSRAEQLHDDATGYALQVARNVCRDELRRRVHRRSWAVQEWDIAGPSVEDVALDRRLIAEAWSQLSTEERPVLADAVRGLSLTEMAAARGITVAAMAQRVRRARLRIRGFVSNPGVAAGPGYAPVDFVRERLRVLLATAGRRAHTPLLDGPATAVAPLVVAALAGGLGTSGLPAPNPHAQPPPLAVNGAPPQADAATGSGPVARIPAAASGATAPLANGKAQPPPLPTSLPTTPPVPPGARFVSFAPSPQYQHDHTLFGVATGTAA